jgi:hypothetical protein
VHPQEIIDVLLALCDACEWGRTETFQFDAFTHFYAAEMGTELVKWIIAFDSPMSPGDLARRKLQTNDAESRWLDDAGNRQINLDAGYLAIGSFVLASTKPAAHRIYLADGIYAEVTLIYESGAYVPLRWTYPDFRQPMITETLGKWRHRVLELSSARH